MLFGKDRFNQNNLLPDMIKGVDFIIEGPDRFGKIFLCRLRLREGFNLTHGIVRGEPDGPSCQSWQMRYLRFCIGRYQAFKRVKVAALHFFRSPPLAIKPGALSIEGQCLIRIAPQKRVSRKMLSPLNRFKQKRVSGVTAYGKKEGNWCQGICQHPPVDRDRSIVLSQNIKCFSVHRPLKIKKPTPENCSGSIKKSIGKNLNQYFSTARYVHTGHHQLLI